MICQENTSVRGGCIQISNTEFDAQDSVFANNRAELGGAIFAIQESVMVVHKSILLTNYAGKGSLVYSMANKINPEVGRDTVFI